MKYMYALFLFVMGILFYVLSLCVFDSNGPLEQFTVVIIFAILSFFAVFLSGLEVGVQEKKPESGAVKFEKLELGSYFFMTIPVQEKKCSLTGNCCQYYAFVERSVGGVIPVEIGVAARIEIEKATGKKSINQIVEGEEFLIR